MNRKKFVAIGGAIVIFVTAAGALSFAHKRSREPVVTLARPITVSQDKSVQPKPGTRNLSLQPEAWAMAQRLGSRFEADKRKQTVIVGTLTIGSEKRQVQTIRTQTGDGEKIEINTGVSGPLLTWDTTQGSLSGGARASGGDADLIERLVFDSPDQFVLAQLRGSSYFTVARNVRPADAGDKYNGPLWNIVRVDDRMSDETKAPQSRWRLYYVNTGTGVIERIESEINGNRTVAEFSGWTKQNGEIFPTQIVWKQKGQTIMQYSVTSFSASDE